MTDEQKSRLTALSSAIRQYHADHGSDAKLETMVEMYNFTYEEILRDAYSELATESTTNPDGVRS